MPSRIRTHKFRGIRYCVETVPGVDGFCDAPVGSMPSLAIMVPLGSKNGLETAIHEALHACKFDKSEKVVTETARDLAKFLKRLGYRKVK